jgi:hypothetical protein
MRNNGAIGTDQAFSVDHPKVEMNSISFWNAANTTGNPVHIPS